MIIGTAGHIDHGKTALVHALTGVDTDRLPEEKRRGITIELGFAPLRLGGGATLGIVDVPGHEAFVRTMLAGATGIDLALLVVAADEGVMPQTREHLAILSLLGVRGGVIALTKRDLVDDEWLSLVTEDVGDLVRGSPLADSEMIGVSSVTGAGIDALRAAIGRAAAVLPARSTDDLFRLPVDRAFSVRGTGTVVTGTVWSGTLRRDDTVRVLPSGRTARVRALEHHGSAVDSVGPGQRAAIALVGVDKEEVDRGEMIVRGDAWVPTTILRAEVALLDGWPRSLGPRTQVRFHLGTSDVGGRVVASPAGVPPGERRAARVILDHPVVARAGDRFVLRTASPPTTIGGGTIEDPLPPHRRARPVPLATSPGSRLERILDEAAAAGVDQVALPVRVGLTPPEVRRLVGSAGDRITDVAGRLYASDAVDNLGGALRRLVDDHHRAHPLDPGVSLQTLRGAVDAPAELVDVVLGRSVAHGELEIDGAIVRRRGWLPSLSEAQAGVRDRLAEVIRRSGREPPSVTELTSAHGDAVPALLRILERGGVVVPVEADRYYATEVLERMIDDLRGRMVAGREYPPAELRDFLGVSRKYLIPLLEYCDRVGVTDRRASGRVLGGTPFAASVVRQGDMRS